VAEATHDFVDINVLCDVEMFKIEVGLIEVESMPQHSKIRNKIVDAKEKVVWKMQLQQLEANQKTWFVLHLTANVWAFFVVNNHFEKVMVGSSLTLRCVICHPTKQCHSFDSTTKS